MSVLKNFKKIFPPCLLTKFKIRFYCSEKKVTKVTVCGAGGKVGQIVSMMLKQCDLINELAVYDIAGIEGLGIELSHIDSACKVYAYTGTDKVKLAFKDASIVVVVASSPRISNTSFTSMFEPNACIMQEVAENFAAYCPTALLAIGTHPIDSLVPLACTILETNRVFNKNRVFGITALDVIRANTVAATVMGIKPACVTIPVIGAHSDRTIIPILSHSQPPSDFSNLELEYITKTIQKAHCEVLKAKLGNEAATLSGAFAISRFVMSLLKALHGESDIVECAYVRSSIHPGTKYLSTPLLLGKNGIEKNYGIPENITDYEQCQIDFAIPVIKKEVQRGEYFAGLVDPKPCDVCSPDPNAPPCPPDFCNR